MSGNSKPINQNQPTAPNVELNGRSYTWEQVQAYNAGYCNFYNTHVKQYKTPPFEMPDPNTLKADEFAPEYPRAPFNPHVQTSTQDVLLRRHLVDDQEDDQPIRVSPLYISEHEKSSLETPVEITSNKDLNMESLYESYVTHANNMQKAGVIDGPVKTKEEFTEAIKKINAHYKDMLAKPNVQTPDDNHNAPMKAVKEIMHASLTAVTTLDDEPSNLQPALGAMVPPPTPEEIQKGDETLHAWVQQGHLSPDQIDDDALQDAIMHNRRVTKALEEFSNRIPPSNVEAMRAGLAKHRAQQANLNLLPSQEPMSFSQPCQPFEAPQFAQDRSNHHNGNSSEQATYKTSEQFENCKFIDGELDILSTPISLRIVNLVNTWERKVKPIVGERQLFEYAKKEIKDERTFLYYLHGDLQKTPTFYVLKRIENDFELTNKLTDMLNTLEFDGVDIDKVASKQFFYGHTAAFLATFSYDARRKVSSKVDLQAAVYVFSAVESLRKHYSLYGSPEVRLTMAPVQLAWSATPKERFIEEFTVRVQWFKFLLIELLAESSHLQREIESCKNEIAGIKARYEVMKMNSPPLNK